MLNVQFGVYLHINSHLFKKAARIAKRVEITLFIKIPSHLSNRKNQKLLNRGITHSEQTHC